MRKVSLILAFLVSGVLFAQETPVGVWKTIDDETGKIKSEVEIYEQGGKLYGKIASLVEPNEPDGSPKICTKCEGADKDKPVLGLVIMKGLSQDGDVWSGGTIMDPNNGKTYKCKIEVIEGGKKLKVRGFIGISLAGRNQFWVRK